MFDRSLNRGMLKSYDTSSDKRTSAWLKLKKDYVDGLGDTLDLVPIGAWHGNGRKAGWWSPVLLAVWDSTKERLIAVCKCMSGKVCCTMPCALRVIDSSGFSDAFYKVCLIPHGKGMHG